jgi:hypothetical protein
VAVVATIWYISVPVILVFDNYFNWSESMIRFNILLFCTAAGVMFLAGCSQSATETTSIIENQVAMAVESTIQSWPTSTPVNTLMPVPTGTAQPTYTPYPTYTPLPTFTPQATYTPYPTWTPTPEDTATAVPTATATPRPATAATAVPPTTAPTTDNLTTLKTEITNTLADIDMYRTSINRWHHAGANPRVVFEPVNCPENLAIRERIISTITLDVSQDIQVVQDAYTVYQNAAQYFKEVTEIWTAGCQEAIANGQTEKNIDNLQRALLTNEIGVAQSWLNSVNDQLKMLGE